MAKELERSYASEIDAAVSGMYEISDRMYDDGLETDAMLLNEGISRLEEIRARLKANHREVKDKVELGFQMMKDLTET